MPGDRRVPEPSNGNTVEERAEDTPGAIGPQDGDHGPGNNAHMSCWEDTEVLHENRGFREKHSSVV